VARHAAAPLRLAVEPDRVLGTFADRLAPVQAEVPFERAQSDHDCIVGRLVVAETDP